jgi:hypothetical protein
MDWIAKIEKHAGTLGRPPIFKDAMTTLSFRLEESLKEDINLLAEYLKRRCDKSSAGAVARAFIASGVEQMKCEYPDLQKFLEQRRSKNNGSEKLPERSELKVEKPSKAKSRSRKNNQKPKTANKVK